MNTARARLALYGIAVGLLGWTSLALLWQDMPGGAGPLLEIALFALLSILIKSLGFQVAPDVTHSLVGVADLAVLFARGPLEAGVVAAVSGGICQVACARSRRPRQWTVYPSLALLGSGLNALMAVVTGWVFERLAGPLPLGQLDGRAGLAVLAVCATWFTLDHLGWATAEWLVSGVSGAVHFVRDILPYSLRVELAPLPFSVLLATAYGTSNAIVVGLAVITLLVASYILRRLITALREERRHVQELSTVDALNQALLSGRFDRNEMSRLVYRFCAQVLDATHFCMQVRAQDGPHRAGDALEVPVLAINGQLVTEADPPLGDKAYRWMEGTRHTVLADSPEALSLAPTLTLGQPALSGLYAPILRGDEYLGLIALHSPRAGAYTAEDAHFLSLAASHAALGLHTARLYQREQQRASQLEAIGQISRKVAAILDLETLFADTVKLVQEAFGYYHVAIFTVDQARERLTFQASSNPSVQTRGPALPWGQGIVGYVAMTGESVLANDVRRDPRYLADLTLPETRAEMSAPLRVEDRILGVLDVQCNRAGALTEVDHAALLTLADQIAIAVEDSNLYKEQQELAWVSTAMLQVADAVGELSTPEEVLDTIVRLTPMLTGVRRCGIFLWSQEEHGFVAVKTAGLTPIQQRSLEAQTFAAGSIPVLDAVHEGGESLTCSAPEFECFLPPPISDNPSTGTVIALPLRSQAQTIGVLVTEGPTTDEHMMAHRQSMLTGIANQAAMALENARLFTAEREQSWVSTALLQVANLIRSHSELDQTIASVLRLTPVLVGIQWCVLWLWDDVRRALKGMESYGLDDETRAALQAQEAVHHALPLLNEIITRQPEDGAPQPVSDLDPSVGALLPANVARQLEAASLTALPLYIQERLLGVLLVAHPEKGVDIPERRMNILSGIAHQIALAIEADTFYKQAIQQQRTERELELAREIQASFVPERFPDVPGWQFGVEWRAARGVGGDFYDLIPLDAQHLGLLIADVSDKGVAAALYMALARTVVRIVAKVTRDPAETLRQVNSILMEDARSGMFVSMFYATLDLESGLLTYARAGHNPPLLLRAHDRAVERLLSRGVVLGILDEPVIESAELTMAHGDALVLYTDGVTEAENSRYEEFGEERLQTVLRETQALTAEALVQRINAAAVTFVGERPQFDDFTLLVVVRDGA